jgi:hypothetical protein
MRSAVIHCNQRIGWQPVRAAYFLEGFRALGIPCMVTGERKRTHEGVPVLLGTTSWRDIELDGQEFILVDRCSFGDTEKFVSLVWNAHGRRGDHGVPEHPNPARWRKIGTPVKAWRRGGSRVIICGQTAQYSPHYDSIEEWYSKVEGATHFKPHPAADAMNGIALPRASNFNDCRLAVTLNSSVGVQAVLDGVPTVTMDEGAMAWGVSTHDTHSTPFTGERLPWCHWLAFTQWSDDEVRDGTALRQLMERG